ncbi:MAG: tetratricopeptide repeat protein [Gammaproteobacteria bacterium]|nr:tetratricopeptide repeat protein [Gammaproteobacteria bacterium]NIN39557.1 tetratricopeptide repeat protein [Gammaproteobacteria bacterium]NIO25114.1 tetratricopeptide repeat protein [Gammaproteobacteria bacterium]NIO65743.1 tetratricopeptide repeat protein [Gammaproteobacteria bacterium]NIP45820.1 tetratricopeptide repeat protein [Gammaproteobacteria bacterium]
MIGRARGIVAAMLAWLAVAASHAQTDIDVDVIREMMDRGEYAAAIERARTALGTDPARADLHNLLGEALFTVGELDAARSAFDEAIGLDGNAIMQAVVNRGLLDRYLGQNDEAEGWLRRAVERYNLRPNMASRELAAAAAAAHALGDADSAHFHDAVRVYGEAIAADPDNVAARVALGNLLLTKYNNTEALEAFREALEIDPDYGPALLGLARSQHFDHDGEAMMTVRAAIERNSNHVAARTFLAQLLIESEQYQEAEQEALRALAVNARALESLAVLAAVYHLTGEGAKFDETVARALAINPRYADLYNTLADLSVKNRLYHDAVEFAARAVAMDPRSWRGFGILGINQLRIGDMDAGRANVARAFDGDPFNVWTKNTLDFLDSSDEYKSIESAHTDVILHADEAALLAPHASALAESAWRYYANRYGWRPEGRVRVELYPDHRDFSVRTVGLAGIGILGVSFGPVVALDSPAARPRGSFNWGSVLWHEIAHSFHMGVSRHRVPRWFSEGLAVYEEQMAGGGWGNDVTLDFLTAYRDGQLLPVSELNNGFVRPTYPEQIGHSYYQASLVFAFIDERWGFSAILEMLQGYAEGKTTPEIVESALGLGMDALDSAFDSYFQKRFERALAALPRRSFADVPIKEMFVALADQFPSNFMLQMRAAAAIWNSTNAESAEKFLKRAQDLIPEYAGEDSAYWYLAELYAQQGDVDKAVDQLRRMIAINADHYDAHVKLAAMLKMQSKFSEAADVLARAIYIFPYDPTLHEDLAYLYETGGRWQLAARARESVLALAPVDMAEAHYRLAYAHLRAGDAGASRYQVLRALEIAPNYHEALELLLELHGHDKNS